MIYDGVITKQTSLGGGLSPCAFPRAVRLTRLTSSKGAKVHNSTSSKPSHLRMGISWPSCHESFYF